MSERFDLVCWSCRFGTHDCPGTIDIPSGPLQGSHLCACFTCRARSAAKARAVAGQ